MKDRRYLAAGITCITLLAGGSALAERPSIYQATLAEANQKTGEVSTGELRRILLERSAIVLDTRSRAEYVAGHIPGAVNLDGPPAEAVSRVERLAGGDKAKALVLYCNGPFCQASRRLSERLVAAGFSNVRRYQLGMPIWRALGGPTEIELEGIVRILGRDGTAVFLDARAPEEFARGTLPGARNVPADQLANGGLKSAPLPEDDFNTRVVLFGRDFAQARALAEALAQRPWHNVSYFPGAYEALREAVRLTK